MASHPVAHMAVAGVACFAFVSVVTGADSPFAVLLGLVGPLTAAIGSWIVLERAHARSSEDLSRVMIKLFGAKLILFGAYVASVVVLLPAGTSAFVVSFVSHYILLHLMEALYLRRLFAVRPDVDEPRMGVS
jgi:hypothetical protein